MQCERARNGDCGWKDGDRGDSAGEILARRNGRMTPTGLLIEGVITSSRYSSPDQANRSVAEGEREHFAAPIHHPLSGSKASPLYKSAVKFKIG